MEPRRAAAGRALFAVGLFFLLIGSVLGVVSFAGSEGGGLLAALVSLLFGALWIALSSLADRVAALAGQVEDLGAKLAASGRSESGREREDG